MNDKDSGLLPLGDILKQAAAGSHSSPLARLQRQIEAAAKPLKPLSRVQNRLLEPCPKHDREICFQHSVLCQTGLPYRNPGDHVLKWQREQGTVSLLITAGEARDPRTHQWVPVGLPWGPKPRLVLAHLNAEALRLGSPEIAVGDSLSAFVKRIRGFDGGREIRMFKDQLTRLSNAELRLAMVQGGQPSQINTHVVTGFELWLPKDERQRVLWPSTVRLSAEYFESLQKHAVPLIEADLAALAHTALGLDIYAWLAQRLHRIDPHKPAFIAWSNLKEQFGRDYKRMKKFKAVFRVALAQVQRRYQTARLELDDRGMTARNSPAPVGKRYALISNPTSKKTAS
jgi:Plasmid encoded RepA protein